MRRFALALALAMALSSCAWLAAFTRVARDGAITGTIAVIMWVICAPAGPVMQGLGIFFGAAGGKAMSDSAAMASGELQGEGAIAKENERLREILQTLKVDVEYYQGRAAAADRVARETRTWADRVSTWAARLGLAILGAYLLGQWRWWVNAARWWSAGERLRAIWSVLHGLIRLVPVPPIAPAPKPGP